MNDRLLLDTHVALWLDSGDARLSATTRRVVDDCWQRGGLLLFSAVSAWEIAMLAAAGRIDLDVTVERWVPRFLDQPGIEAMPLDHRAAVRSYQLREFERRDPADRLLIATAIELGCPLVTYDAAIRRFGETHGRRYGFAAIS